MAERAPSPPYNWGMSDNTVAPGEKLAEFALSQVHKYLAQKDDGHAFANYLLVLKLLPEHASEHKSSFVECLGRWSRTLKAAGRIQDMLTCHHEASTVLPKCPEILNGLGTELFSLGFVDEAASYFRKALTVDPSFVLANHNLQNLCGHLVERWHFRMLNDIERNKAYRTAIQRAVGAGYSSVIDVGSGTGILSMLAAEEGATPVYGCEMSKTMYEVCRDCLAENNATAKVTMMNKKSTELRVPEDITQRCSLLVTETFDAGLLGEHILDTMAHAFQHLLVNDQDKKACVIPQSADVYICAVECEAIRKHNRCIYPGARHLDFGDCVFVCASHTSDSTVPGFSHHQTNCEHWNSHLDNSQHGINYSGCQSDVENKEHQIHAEPYTSHRLEDLPGGYKSLSEKIHLSEFIFDNPKHISEYRSGFQLKRTLTITTHGQLDAFALWFDLHLDQEVTLTSAPGSVSCWEQAIYPVVPMHVKGHCPTSSLLTRQGDEVTISVSCYNNAMHLQCIDILHKNSHETYTTTEISTEPKPNVLAISRDEITRLNDLSWNQAYCQALEEVRSPHLSVLSLIPDMTILPLQALMIGATEACVISPYDHCDVVNTLAECNSLDPARIHTVGAIEEVDGLWEVLITDVVDPSGALRQQVLEEVALARMTCMPPSGLVIPQSISIYGVLVESDSLLADSLVTSDDNTLGIKVTKVINDFQMTHHLDVCLTTLKHKRLSQPFQLLTFDLNQPLEADSELDLTFLKQESTFGVVTSDCGRVGAVVYWFDLLLSPSVTYSTLDASSHVQQAAVILREPFSVNAGVEVFVHAACRNSCVDVTVSLPTE